MKLKVLGICGALALLSGAVACTKASPTRPSDDTASGASTSVVDAVTGVTLTSPTPVAPTANQQFKFAEQPLTLTVANAVSTGTTATTASRPATRRLRARSFQIASVGSAQCVENRHAGGPRPRALLARGPRAAACGPTGVRGFGVGAAVTLTTPVLASPAAGGTVGGQPTLTVNNVQKTGPAGQIVYRFEISTAASFGSVLAAATATEQGGGATSTTINANLGNGNYFWRAQASDPSNGITTPFSAASPFTVQLFDLQKANIWDNPPDFKSWAETSQVTSVTFTDDAILVDFDKRDGPDRWPDVGFGSGALEYTLGMCVNIQGTWNCSATIQFWYGRDLEASGLPSYIAANWWYDTRWGALQGYQPTCGETVGIYAAAGNLRDSGNVIAKERTNIVLMPFCGAYRAGVGVLSGLRSKTSVRK